MEVVLKSVFALGVCLSCSFVFADDEYIQQTEDKIFEIQQTKQEILQKAEICMLKIIKNDSVMLVGTSTGFDGIFGVGKRNETVTNIPSGDVIRLKDTNEGIIFANSRIDVKANLISYSVQTMIDFAAKDGKFKITHKDIVYLQKDVGYGTPDTYKKLPVKDKWGSSLNKNTLKALDEVTQQLAVCVQTISNNSNW